MDDRVQRLNVIPDLAPAMTSLERHAELVISQLQREAGFEKQLIDDDCSSVPQDCPRSNSQGRLFAIEFSK